MISVAVCDKPAGKYEFYGYVKYADGTPIGKKEEPLQFDPGVFMDDDETVSLYRLLPPVKSLRFDGSSRLETCNVLELDPADMLTVKMGPKCIGGASERSTRKFFSWGHPFLEASSMRKFNEPITSSTVPGTAMSFAIQQAITLQKAFEFGGVLVSEQGHRSSWNHRCKKCKKLYRKHLTEAL